MHRSSARGWHDLALRSATRAMKPVVPVPATGWIRVGLHCEVFPARDSDIYASHCLVRPMCLTFPLMIRQDCQQYPPWRRTDRRLVR